MEEKQKDSGRILSTSDKDFAKKILIELKKFNPEPVESTEPIELYASHYIKRDSQQKKDSDDK